MNDVSAIIPITMASASSLVTPSTSCRILTIARFTQPRMMQLIGNAEIEGAEAAQEGGGFAGVADFGEFDVGHDAGAAPQAGVEEDGEHAARDEVPPQPVARDAAHRRPCR